MLLPMLNVLYFYISTFPNYVCSAQYDCFLQFLDFVLSRYVAQVFSEWFWDGSVVPIITGIASVITFHMRCISIVRSLYYESSRLRSWSHFCLLKLQHLLTYMFLIIIIIISDLQLLGWYVLPLHDIIFVYSNAVHCAFNIGYAVIIVYWRFIVYSHVDSYEEVCTLSCWWISNTPRDWNHSSVHNQELVTQFPLPVLLSFKAATSHVCMALFPQSGTKRMLLSD
jgi:hypothetical protein